MAMRNPKQNKSAAHTRAPNTSPWGGRFEEDQDALANAYSQSVTIDSRLALHDIQSSLAHAEMLCRQGIISKSEARELGKGLKHIKEHVLAGTFVWDRTLEDVHMNIEHALTKRVGPVGGKLHTARSRNDQVATDLRLWVRDSAYMTIKSIDAVIHELLRHARRCVHIAMPGYTHVQRAQPVRLSHHLLAWAWGFLRDRARIIEGIRRGNQCPLGAGALATTPFDIDRAWTADAMFFDEPVPNSMDAVSDRDFLLEYVSHLSICAVRLSRIGEELVLWSSQEFGFVTMGDAFATGSSMMPQKKNPDMAELMRGKSGRVLGDWVSIFTLMKGLPLTYNRDMQEDKQPLFDAHDTVLMSLDVLKGMLSTLHWNEDAMNEALSEGFVLATEVADYLSERGVPFREAHHVAGRLVHDASKQGLPLEQLPLETFRKRHALFDADVFKILDPKVAIERRKAVGGPSKKSIEAQISKLQTMLKSAPWPFRI